MRSTRASTDSRLALRGLSVAYAGSTEPAVGGIDLDVGRGEVLAVVGESGAGKTSIGAALLDLVDPPGRWSADVIELDGERIDYAAGHSRGRDVSAIFQDPQTALNPLFTVEAQLTHMVRHHLRLGAAEAGAKAVDMLAEVGIAQPAARVKQYPHQFSGGMRQRVVIALAIACDPRLVIADEPTSALDASTRGQVLDLIRRLARERGAAVLLITHDMAAVERIADRVAVMRAGRIVETAPTRRLLTAPRDAYSQMLIAAVPPSDRSLRRFAVPEPERPTASAVHGAANLDDWLRAKGREADAATLLCVEGALKRFALRPRLFGRGGETLNAVDGVSLSLRRGEVLGLVGESGSGKSTLAQLVAGLHPLDAGAITFGHHTLTPRATDRELRAYRRGLQMIFQDPFSSLNRRMRVADAVAEPIRTAGEAGAGETLKIVAALLERVGLPSDAMRRHPHAFSGGQRQRIALARALAGRPRLLICDEPTSALDVSIQAQLINLLKDLQEDLKLSILFISHDLPMMRQVAGRIAVMRAGRILETQPTEALFEAPTDPYTRELLAELPRRSGPAASGARNG